MTIQEVAKKYNLSEDTLRYYEKAGMIPAVHRTPAGDQRLSTRRYWLGRARCLSTLRRLIGRSGRRLYQTLSARREDDPRSPEAAARAKEHSPRAKSLA